MASGMEDQLARWKAEIKALRKEARTWGLRADLVGVDEDRREVSGDQVGSAQDGQASDGGGEAGLEVRTEGSLHDLQAHPQSHGAAAGRR